MKAICLVLTGETGEAVHVKGVTYCQTGVRNLMSTRLHIQNTS